jgi:hypothetical protein
MRDVSIYQVSWSEEDGEYVGTCDAYPGLSHLDTDPDEALRGIKALVAAIIAYDAIPTIGSDAATPLDDPYMLMSLRPRNTGLPMTVWITPAYDMPEPPVMKAAQIHGDLPGFENLAIVSLRPTVEVLSGNLSEPDLDAVRQWVDLNRDVLIEYWDEADSVAVIKRLRKLAS